MRFPGAAASMVAAAFFFGFYNDAFEATPRMLGVVAYLLVCLAAVVAWPLAALADGDWLIPALVVVSMFCSAIVIAERAVRTDAERGA